MMPTVASLSNSSVMVSKSFQRVSLHIALSTMSRTYGSLIAQRVEHVQRSGVTLLGSPDEVNPGW